MTEQREWNSNDIAMRQLFRAEVETQVALLNDGLLALERDAHATSVLATLMRAAHSIKGAARVVQLDVAEQVAHALEDCFVAAQEGKAHFSGEHIEVLLRGADMLLRVAQEADIGADQWLTAPQAEIAPLLEALAALIPAAAPLAPAGSPEKHQHPPSPPALPHSTEESIQPASSQEHVLLPPVVPEPGMPGRVLRVTVENLNQLLGLAGESLVESRRLPHFAQALLQLKSNQRDLSVELDTLLASLQGLDLPVRAAESLHTAQRKAEACRQMLADRLAELELLVRRSEHLSERLYRSAIASHMRPFEDGVLGLPRMVRDLARELGKQARLDIIGRATEVDRDILERLEAPLSHLLRNAIDHGIESPDERLAAGKPAEGTIRLEARHQGGMLSITVVDDGRGVDVEQVRRQAIGQHVVTAEVASVLTDAELLEFLFLPAFSTATTVTAISGRGVGLDVVRSMVHAVGGLVSAFSLPGKGMRFHLQLPLTLSVLRVLVVDIAGEPYAFPLARLDRVLLVPEADIDIVEESWYVNVDGQRVALVSAHQVLEVPACQATAATLSVVVVSDRLNRYGLIVDRFLGETELVVQALDPRLGKIPDINAAALLEDGSPVLIIDVEDVVRSTDNLLAGRRWRPLAEMIRETRTMHRQRVLVVEDSLTVREVERQLLAKAGYDVEAAVDGMDGWNALRTGRYDLVITDVDMPRMGGLELVRRIREDPHLRLLPVMLMSYKGEEADRCRGLAAGANVYFAKNNFHEANFLQAVLNLLNAAAAV